MQELCQASVVDNFCSCVATTQYAFSVNFSKPIPKSDYIASMQRLAKVTSMVVCYAKAISNIIDLPLCVRNVWKFVREIIRRT